MRVEKDTICDPKCVDNGCCKVSRQNSSQFHFYLISSQANISLWSLEAKDLSFWQMRMICMDNFPHNFTFIGFYHHHLNFSDQICQNALQKILQNNKQWKTYFYYSMLRSNLESNQWMLLHSPSVSHIWGEFPCRRQAGPSVQIFSNPSSLCLFCVIYTINFMPIKICRPHHKSLLSVYW